MSLAEMCLQRLVGIQMEEGELILSQGKSKMQIPMWFLEADITCF